MTNTPPSPNTPNNPMPPSIQVSIDQARLSSPKLTSSTSTLTVVPTKAALLKPALLGDTLPAAGDVTKGSPKVAIGSLGSSSPNTMMIDAKQGISSTRQASVFKSAFKGSTKEPVETIALKELQLPDAPLSFAMDTTEVLTFDEALEEGESVLEATYLGEKKVLLLDNAQKRESRAKRDERDALAKTLWDKFTENPGDTRTRDKLAVHYLYLIKQAVLRLPVVLPPSLCQDDLIGFGTIGLLEAIQRFEPRRGFKFESFATTRIRGEIIDQLRKHDWVPRGVRRRTKVLMQTIQELEQTLGRHPSSEEVAEKLGLPLAKVNALMNEATTLVVSLDEHAYEDKEGGGMAVVDTVADTSSDNDPMQQIIDGNDRQRLAQAIASLPEREKLLIALYYQENMTLREIGDIISVSESRVCQLHAQAICRLRHVLRGL